MNKPQRTGQTLILIVLLMTLAGRAAAGEELFGVQIAAYAQPEVARVDKARKIGQVYTTSRPGGLTAFIVGRYETVDEARMARAQLREIGFEDAFIARIEGTETASIDQPLPTPGAAPGEGQLVLLDGQPHWKNEDVFTPVQGRQR